MSAQITGLLKKPQSYAGVLQDARARLSSQIKGKNETVELALATLLAGGHLLLEGPPGTGKTALARSLAGVTGGSFKRIQMTSDLLPSDIVGILRVKAGSTDFEFREGPIFSNFLLADELNRTGPKTQSALLEAMAEGTVTVDGVQHVLPDPFFVVATQNPIEFQGVYPLAESQLDRFMLRLSFDCPERESELEIYRRSGGDSAGSYASVNDEAILSLEAVRAIRGEVTGIHIEDSVMEYCADLVRATRGIPEAAHGVSVRGGLQLISAVRGLAYVRGRDYVSPADVQALAVPVLAHRLCFMDGPRDPVFRKELIDRLLERIRAPK